MGARPRSRDRRFLRRQLRGRRHRQPGRRRLLDLYGRRPDVSSGGKPTVIAETEGTNLLLFQSSPRINDAGVVAFNARLDSGGVGIFTANTPGVRKIVENVTGPFAGLGLGNPAINNRGVVAFDANKFEFRATYTGTDLMAGRVIQTGDPLDGSTVQWLSTGSHGRFLDNAGQLADGRTGIYRADPLSMDVAAVPEPATPGLVVAARWRF